MISITTQQLNRIIKQHDIPDVYRERIVAALRDAFKLGHNADCMKVKHKEPAK